MKAQTRLSVRLAAIVGSLAIAPATLADDHGHDDRAAAILEAMELPEVAHKLREAGMEEEEVKGALDTLRNDKADARRAAARARRAAAVLAAEAEAAETDGPMKGFGGFVRAQVAQGVRGKELGAAIREERANHPRGAKGRVRAEGAGEAGTDRAEGARDRAQGKAQDGADRAEGARARAQGKAQDARDRVPVRGPNRP